MTNPPAEDAALTVEALLRIPHLGSHLVAGHSGRGTRVSWAHVCELSRPWEWVSPGDLLLTIGYGVPREAAEQVRYIEALHHSQIAGVAIGDHPQAPTLSKSMLRAADNLGLPVLRTVREVSFSSIIRAVAAANQSAEYERLVQTLRIYDLVRFALARRDPFGDLMRMIEVEIGCQIHVVDPAGQALLAEAPLPTAAGDAFRADRSRHAGHLTAVTRFEHAGVDYLGVPLPVHDGAFLISSGASEEIPAVAMLHHVGAVLTLEVERRKVASDRQRLLGQSLWERLLEGRADPVIADSELASHRLVAERGLRVVAFHQSRHLSISDVGTRLDDGDIPYLGAERPPDSFLLVPGGEGVLRVLDEAFEGVTPAGCSNSHVGAGMIAEAVREARWSLASAGDLRQLVRYGEQVNLFLPGTVDEARAVVQRILGPLLRYDEEHGTSLLTSLQAFLENNRSWQRTSRTLTVHKQTLVYRMRRVEQLTGQHLNSTADVAVLWLALRAHDIVKPR